jgi:hypothetical protein
MYESQDGVWKLVAPSGDTWEGDSPMRCLRKEKDERIPAAVQLERLAVFLKDDDWTGAKEAPDSELLEHGDWGTFWCFFADEDSGVKQQGVRIFTEGSGWNDDGVTHWMPLPDAPKCR